MTHSLQRSQESAGLYNPYSGYRAKTLNIHFANSVESFQISRRTQGIHSKISQITYNLASFKSCIE